MTITPEEKKSIREQYEEGESYSSLADKYGVTRGRIYQIIKKYKMKT